MKNLVRGLPCPSSKQLIIIRYFEGILHLTQGFSLFVPNVAPHWLSRYFIFPRLWEASENQGVSKQPTTGGGFRWGTGGGQAGEGMQRRRLSPFVGCHRAIYCHWQRSSDARHSLQTRVMGKLMNAKSAPIALSAIIAVSLLLASCGKPKQEANAQVDLATNNVGQLTNDTAAPAQEQRELPELRQNADKGDPSAEFLLGKRYEDGLGVESNQIEAVKWYRKAAEQGNADAQYRLGRCCVQGLGVATNQTEAFQWFRRAAEQGHVWGQLGLASCYDEGEGVEKNQAEAVKWYRKAAKQGNAQAQYNLGVCYSDGEGVEKNQTEAVKWYRKAAERGNAKAQVNLGFCCERGSGVEKNLTEAVKWYRRAADQGDAGAQFNLGTCYALGEGVPKDLVEAYTWFNLAASQELTTAAEEREHLALSMTPAQLAEARRRSSEFVPKKEGKERRRQNYGD